MSCLAWGKTLGIRIVRQRSAESAIQRVNPRHTARRKQADVCAAARGIPLGMCECDGVLVAR